MKRIKMAVFALAITAGVGGALASKANTLADNTYYVTGQDGNNWKVQAAPISCSQGSEPCRVTSSATASNGEIPKSSVTQVISTHAF